VAAATVPIIAALALFFTAPWNNSHGFLERAQAALTPTAGMIRHEKREATFSSTEPACVVTRGPNEIWIDQTPPHRYRAVVFLLPPAPLDCSRGSVTEVGGTLEPQQTLVFVPPNTLRPLPGRFAQPLDPVSELREAISAGRAHDEGMTQLDGRTVERIRIDSTSECPDPNCPREPSYAYVDPETFYPVRLESPDGFLFEGGRSVVRFHFVLRFLAFEYLTRTPANLSLTDIRAQHSNATGT